MKTKSNLLKLFSTIVLVFVIVMTGCKHKEEDVIKIGAIVFLTGESSSLGEPLKNGLLLAVEQINNSGGIEGKKVKLILEDSKSTANGTINAYRKLVRDKVIAIISTGDIELRALNEIANQYHIPIIATAATGGLENWSEWIFRYCYSEQSQKEELIDFIINDLGTKNLVLVYPNSSYGLDIKNYTNLFTHKFGGNVLAAIPYEMNSVDQRATALKAINENPEIIIIRGYGIGFESVLRSLSEQRYGGILAGDITIGIPSTIEKLHQAVNGSYFVASFLDNDSEDELIQDYINSYRNKFKLEPGFWDALSYDSFLLLRTAIEKAGTDNLRLKDTLYYLPPVNCLLGKHGFNESTDVNFELNIFQIVNQEIILVD